MEIDEIKMFKKELGNYINYINKVNKLKLDLDVMWYDLTGVKGVRYDKEPTQHSYNESYSEEMRLNALEKIKKVEDSISRIQSQIDYVESVLMKMPNDIRTACIDIYCRDKTYAKVSSKIGYSASGLEYTINKYISVCIQ